MNCAYDKEKLTGYYDGELDTAEKADVERHIASCSECLRELGELKSAAILVKELPRLRAPRSIAEGVSREIQSAGQVHRFTRLRRTVLWASAVAAALLVGVNVIYFSSASKAPAPDMALAQREAPPVVPMAKMAPRSPDPAPPPAEAETARRSLQLRDSAERSREARKAVEEHKEAGQKADMPADRGRREKDRADGLLAKPEAPKPEPKPAAAAPPPAPPAAERPSAAPPKPAAPIAPVAKSKEEGKGAAPVPAEPALDKAVAGKDGDKQLGRAEADLKSKAAVHGETAGPTHLTLAATQISKARPQMEEALRKMGVPLPQPPPGVKAMKAPSREAEQIYALELTESQIARLRQELEKPGASRLVTGAPGDPVLAEFRTGIFAGAPKKEAAATGGAAAPAAKSEPGARDSKEPEDAAAKVEGFLMEKKIAGEPRRKVVLHLLEVPFVPDRQPAGDPVKK